MQEGEDEKLALVLKNIEDAMQRNSGSHREISVCRRLQRMYGDGEAFDDLVLLDLDFAAIDCCGFASQALAEARRLPGRELISLGELLAYRPPRRYSDADTRFRSRRRPPTYVPTMAKTRCPICGQRDNDTPIRNGLCLECFCRECWSLVDAAKEANPTALMKFDDAAEWVRRQSFPRDKLFAIAVELHEQLARRDAWPAVVRYFSERHIDIGRWTMPECDFNRD